MGVKDQRCVTDDDIIFLDWDDAEIYRETVCYFNSVQCVLDYYY